EGGAVRVDAGDPGGPPDAARAHARGGLDAPGGEFNELPGDGADGVGDGPLAGVGGVLGARRAVDRGGVRDGDVGVAVRAHVPERAAVSAGAGGGGAGDRAGARAAGELARAGG